MASIDERYPDLYQGSSFAGKGKIKCGICGKPTIEHRISQTCLDERRGVFTSKEKGDRWTPAEERVTRYKGIPQVRVSKENQ